MRRFLYTVWFRDTAADPSEEDHEWPACMLIEALTQDAARAWGDSLAAARCQRHPADIFLHSQISVLSEHGSSAQDRLPVLRAGESATDEEIGW